MPEVLALRPVTGCGHCSDDDDVDLADCRFFVVEVDVDDEANVARRSSSENMAVVAVNHALKLADYG